MLDPASAIALATSAYSAIKKGIEIGRELQDMGGQLSQWATAVSDLEFLERRTQDPPWYKMFGNSVQAEAVEIFAARKKIEQQRAELKLFIQYSHGQSAWEELLKIEADVRKRRAAHEHRKAEIKEMIISGILIFLMVSSISAFLAVVLWLYVEQNK